MAPPKKDAFADLFQSANTKSTTSASTKLSLLERQAQQNKFDPIKPMQGVNGYSSFSNQDIFSGSDFSNVPSRSETPSSLTPKSLHNGKMDSNDNNSFDIFDLTSDMNRNTVHVAIPNSTPRKTEGNFNSNAVSLLDDDEFTDAFKATKIKEGPRNVNLKVSNSIQEDTYDSSDSPSKAPKNSTDIRDTVLAELIDIGFSIEISNQAIDTVGSNLQECVNYIMGGGDKKKAERTGPPPNSNRHNESASKINDFSSDFLNLASGFLSQSKKAVMKNIQQFQQGHSEQSDPGMPAWMRSQHKYKADAIEKKYKGHKTENYGSDEENIDQDAIQEYMKIQKQKEKEKSKARYENWKSMAKDSIVSGRSSPKIKPALPERPSSQPVPSKSLFNDVLSSNPIKTPELRDSEMITKPITFSKSSEKSSELIQEADLLGFDGPPSSRFKNSKVEENVYVSPARRRTKSAAKTIATPLDKFSESDYQTAKEKATHFFNQGDYDSSLSNYMKCLEVLPSNHELRIVMNSNISLNYIKLGDYKNAKAHCEDGLNLIDKSDVNSDVLVSAKPIKVWYIKLLSRKAESLEMLELFPESLACYIELLQLGANDKKTMDGKRRVNNIVNPPAKAAPRAKPQSSKPVVVTRPTNENLNRVRDHHEQQKSEENLKFELHDKIQNRLSEWSHGKEDNLRSLLVSLTSILPEHLGFPFLTTKKIAMGDLMLPKKVKINYMKVISSIHPDKLSSLAVDDKMLCQGVFITLNKSWDLFKEQNGM